MNNSDKKLAWLVDPENVLLNDRFASQLKSFSTQHYILVGGSTCKQKEFEACCQFIRKHSTCHLVIFPGDYFQISNYADELLLLSLISGRNPDFLIGEHVKAAKHLAKTTLTISPTGYILIDGGRLSSTAKKTKTQALPADDIDLITSTALAGSLLGMTNIYLEAGSGANKGIQTHLIEAVKKTSPNTKLWVGGGIKTVNQITSAFKSGADVVVIGNAIEKNPNLLQTLFKNELVSHIS